MTLSSIITFLFIGICAGSLMGLLGIGCGLIVVPLLAFWLPKHGIPEALVMKMAIATSLMVVLVSAFSSVVAHHRYKRVQWFFIHQYGPEIILGAVLGALLVHYLQMRILEIVFGIIVILVALYTGTNLWRTQSNFNNDDQLFSKKYSLILGGVTSFIGLVSSMIGIGGGTFMVPLLRKLRFPLLYAIGTSVACGSIISITGLITMLASSYHLPNLPPWSFGYLYLPAFILIAPISFLFAQIAARISTYINLKIMQLLLTIVLLIIGIKMLL